jgi:hypothetical protein
MRTPAQQNWDERSSATTPSFYHPRAGVVVADARRADDSILPRFQPPFSSLVVPRPCPTGDSSAKSRPSCDLLRLRCSPRMATLWQHFWSECCHFSDSPHPCSLPISDESAFAPGPARANGSTRRNSPARSATPTRAENRQLTTDNGPGRNAAVMPRAFSILDSRPATFSGQAAPPT